MRYFKLKALSCSGKGNRVLRKSANEVYQEGAFHDPDTLVDRGYIYETDANGNPLDGPVAPVDDSSDEIIVTGGALAAAAAAAAGESEADDDDSPIAGKTHKKFKKDKLQELCDEVSIVYTEDDTKADLFELLEGHYGPA